MKLIKEKELVVEEFNKRKIITKLFKIPILLNRIYYIKVLFNGGSAFYGLINKFTA